MSGTARPDFTAADAVVSALVAADVRTIFALPGEENLPMVSAIKRSPIELLVCRHEQHAAFLAVASARLTGRVGVCLATLGPGALNLFTGLAQAQLLGVPVLAITGQKSARNNDEGSFQVLDVVGAARSIIGRANALGDPRNAFAETVAAIRAAEGPNPGAVLLELAEDVAAAPADDRGPVQRRSRLSSGSPTGSGWRTVSQSAQTALQAAAAVIERSSTPLIVVGVSGVAAAAAGDDASNPITRFAEGTGIPVITTQMGAGSIPADHPLALGTLGMHRPDYSHLALSQADLVITVGYQPVEHPPPAWLDADLPVVHLHHIPAAVEFGYLPSNEVIGSIAAGLAGLAEHLTARHDWGSDEQAAIAQCLAEERAQHLTNGVGDGADGPLGPLDVVVAVQEASEPGTVVSLDNGLYKIWFARHFRSQHPHHLMLDNATASMGAGLANATEAARLGHDSIAVLGDGGFMMNLADLETAVRLGNDLTVVVVRDDAYGFIAWHQDEQSRAEHGVEFANPDFVTLAESFGAGGHRVDADHGLDSLLDLCRRRGGVQVIDCPLAYRYNEVLERDDLLDVARRQLVELQASESQT